MSILKQFLYIILCASLFVQAPKLASAQDFQSLFQGFDPRSLSRVDKRFLQTALAFKGHYNGLLDGSWGKISANALGKYSRIEFGTETENWHMATLALSFFNLVERDGWDMRYIEPMGMSVLWPKTAFVTDPKSADFLNYRHSNSSLAISIGLLSQDSAENIHTFTLESHYGQAAQYSVRKPQFAITDAVKRDGSRLYARSSFIDGLWSTIVLSASSRDIAYLNAVAASISVGDAPQIEISNDGILDIAIEKAVALASKADEKPKTPSNVNVPPIKKTDEESSGSSGSGFFVSDEGYALTNAHVVNGCNNFLLDGKKASIVTSSEEFDLALLKLDSEYNGDIAVFAAQSAKLNSDVIAVGFPYAGLLGGLNVTRGSISALKGIGGDATKIQMTSPVQSGNSGGPLLSSDGEVVGVVVSKLDATWAADNLGDTPQNVNFAVRGAIAKLFLSQNGVDPLLSLTDDNLPPVELAEKAQGFTTFVQCK